MVYDKVLSGERISLRALTLDDCSDRYVAWLNDVEVNKYLETRWETQTLDTVLRFVNDIIDSNHSYLFAIIENSTDRHIGNIKIGPIHPIYKNADISYFLGDRNVWGKGYATEAVKLVVDFAFNVLSLHRVQAGLITGNESSSKVLLNNGFVKEGELREKFLIDGEYRNHIIYGLLSSSEKTDF